MDYISLALQCIVSISILNVWLLRKNSASQWRGGDATTIIEEFKVYGLPTWLCYVVGALKVLFAIGLLGHFIGVSIFNTHCLDGTAKRNQSVKKMVIGAVRHCFLDQYYRCTFVRPENASSS